MNQILVPMMESWNNAYDLDKFEVIKSEVNNFLKSDYKHKQPLFVFFQFTWTMNSDRYVDLEYIISYMKNEICETHGWEFSDCFRIILQKTNSSIEFADQINQRHGFRLVDSIEYFCARSYVYESFKSEPQWNSESEKCLMLFGKMSRKYRCDVFKLLADNGLLTEDKVLWTLEFMHFSKPLQQRMMNNIDYQKYLSYERSLDEDKYKTFGSVGFVGYPYDENFYAKTTMSVIFETYAEHTFGPHNYLTEKTWRAISNKHPFLLITSVDMIEHLNEIGFHTFVETYLPSIEDYALEKVTKYFPEHYVKFRSFVENNPQEVKDMVEHNYKLYKQLAQSTVNDLPFKLSDDAFLPRHDMIIPASRLMIDIECLTHTNNEILKDKGILDMYENF